MNEVSSKNESLLKMITFKIKRSEMEPEKLAMFVLEFLITIVENTKKVLLKNLIDEIKLIWREFSRQISNSFISENVYKRVLDAIRAMNGSDVDDLLKNKGLRSIIYDCNKKIKNEKVDYNARIKDIKHELIQELLELKSEILESYSSASSFSVDHIHSREIILTFGYSKSVFEFLKEAAKFRKYDVIVAESAPSYNGMKMAKVLSEAEIDTTLIPDSAAFAMMARVNKIIFSPFVAFSSGNVLAQIGAKNIISAARFNQVTVIALLELYKMSPREITEFNFTNEYQRPQDIVGVDSDLKGKVEILNPKYDLIKSNEICLFVTNLFILKILRGGYSPNSLYRLLEELYNVEDICEE